MLAAWITAPEKYVPYNKEIHGEIAYKFLYWENEGAEILIVCGIATTRNHKQLWNFALNITPKKWPNGAGEISGGRIIEWDSLGLEITTPLTLRPRIAEILGLKNDNLLL